MRAFGGGGRGTKGRCRAVGVQPSSVCQCQDSRRRSIPPEARVVSSGVLVRFRYPCPSSGYTNPFFLLHPTRRALLREPSHITCDIGNAPPRPIWLRTGKGISKGWEISECYSDLLKSGVQSDYPPSFGVSFHHYFCCFFFVV